MKKIVAPVDFSDVSLNAARYAAHMASFLRIPLQLMHVTIMPLSYGQHSMPMMMNEETPHEKLQQLSKDLAEELMGRVDIELIHRMGSPVYEIKSFCDSTRPYAVIMGSHCDSSLTRFFLGSTTIGLINECDIPVIVVPKDFEYRTPRKIGLASDFQDVFSTTPSQKIHELVETFGANLEIIHVQGQIGSTSALMEASWEFSSMFATEKPKVRILKSVTTEDTLLNYAAENLFDMLIVLPRKHNWFDLLVKEQHTNQLVLHATVPVMLLKQEG